jgi:hypothetical protein
VSSLLFADAGGEEERSLPHRDQDPVMRLMARYYDPADTMFELFEKLDRQRLSGKRLSLRRQLERQHFMILWLSSLYVTLEGLEDICKNKIFLSRPREIPLLATRASQILTYLSTHKNALRLLRNATFHFHHTAEKHLQFFLDGGDRLAWAKQLHMLLERLFADYQVQCMVICALADRTDEIDIRRRAR